MGQEREKQLPEKWDKNPFTVIIFNLIFKYFFNIFLIRFSFHQNVICEWSIQQIKNT